MRTLLTLGCLLIAIPAGLARAEDAPEPGPAQEAPKISEEDRAELRRVGRLAREVLQLFRNGRHEDALPKAQEVYDVRKRILGENHPATARALADVAAQYMEMRELDRAIELNLRAYETLRGHFGTDGPPVGAILNNLGSLYKLQGRLADAGEMYSRSVSIWETAAAAEGAGPQAAEQLLTSLGNLAINERDRYRVESARSLSLRSLELAKELGKSGLALARYQLIAAQASTKANRTAEALALYAEVAKTYETAYGPRSPAVAHVMNLTADAHFHAGSHELAIEVRERALDILRPHEESQLKLLSSSLLGLGRAHLARGRFERAEAYLRESLAVRRRVQPEWRVGLARSLHHLARVLVSTGKYDEALGLYDEARTQLEAHFGREHVEIGAVLNDYGVTLSRMGSYEESLVLFRRAHAVIRASAGPDHPQTAASLGNVATALHALDRTEEALDATEQALEIAARGADPDAARRVALLGNRARLLHDLGRLDEASDAIELAVRTAEGSIGLDHPHGLWALQVAGLMAMRRGRHADAVRLTDRRRQESLAVFGEASEEYADALVQHARAEIAASESSPHEEHARPFLDALRILEAQIRRQLAGQDAGQRIRTVRRSRRVLQHWLNVAPAVGQTGYAEVLRIKGLATRVTGIERRLSRHADEGSRTRLAELGAAERRVAMLANDIPFGRARRAAWRERYAAAAAERERLATELAADVAPLALDLERLDLGVADVAGRLAADEVLVDVLLDGDRYLAFVVDATARVRRLDLGAAAEVDALAEAFVERTASPDTAIDDPDWLAAGRRLRDRVLTPVLEALAKRPARLVLCPDGALSTVPFAALPLVVDGGNGNGKPEFLIDAMEFRRVSTAQDLVPLAPAGAASGTGLFVGGVVYDKPGADEGTPADRDDESTAARRPSSPKRFLFLAETETEVRAIASDWGETATVLTGRAATEAALRARSRECRVLHIATHGFVRDDLLAGLKRRSDSDEWLGLHEERQLASGYDPLVLAGLAMAGASVGDGGGGDDGILTAAEVSYMELDGTELVVLSACETALGSASAGEGVFGLVRGFRMAGARSVVASLWQVDDAATRVFMEALYERLNDETAPTDPAGAIRHAARVVRGTTGADGRSFAGPAFWAAFACYGE